MTPKEKAEELVLRYLRIDNNTKEWFNLYIAKQCALIAVDEILKAREVSPGGLILDGELYTNKLNFDNGINSLVPPSRRLPTTELTSSHEACISARSR